MSAPQKRGGQVAATPVLPHRRLSGSWNADTLREVVNGEGYRLPVVRAKAMACCFGSIDRSLRGQPIQPCPFFRRRWTWPAAKWTTESIGGYTRRDYVFRRSGGLPHLPRLDPSRKLCYGGIGDDVAAVQPQLATGKPRMVWRSPGQTASPLRAPSRRPAVCRHRQGDRLLLRRQADHGEKLDAPEGDSPIFVGRKSGQSRRGQKT